MKYIVIEVQTANDGTVAYLATVHETKQDAEQKFHQILSYAAVSDKKYHSAVILNDRGEWIKGETYEHDLG